VGDIFQEVDEDLRRDRLLQLVQRYGKYAVALAGAVILATGGVTWWRAHDLQVREKEGDRYVVAMQIANNGKLAESADALAAMAREAHPGRALIARFQAAGLRARSGDETGAGTDYDALAKDSSIDPVYRDLAIALWALHMLNVNPITVDPQAVVARLAPITDVNNPWHPTAIELTAVAHLKAGDRAAAQTDYRRLSDDLTAPAALRARAAEMVAALAS
jgi:hypothetical protein